MNRRQLLQSLGGGFGWAGMQAALQGAEGARRPHFTPKAKHVIFLFLNGGMSQVDTFDPKPALAKFDGTPMPGPKIKTDRASGNLMRSPWEFRRHGQSGLEVSEIFPGIAKRIDDFCVVRSMYTDTGNHGPSLQLMNCGHQLPGRPSMGAWVTYGLGTENRNLPGFVVLCPGFPVLGSSLWSSGYMPSHYQGVHIQNSAIEPEKLVPNLRNANLNSDEQRKQLDLAKRLNQKYLQRTGADDQIESAVQSLESAFRLQTEAAEVFDIRKEPEKTRARYDVSDFGRGCLMALRMVERGVRMVQMFYGNGQPWDNHDDIRVHAKLAAKTDGPIAALVDDLKLRGLFDETLIIIGSEFGRTPMIQNSGLEKLGCGRDHNVPGFTVLLAGGGVKGGMAYGATDEFGFKAVENKVHVHDLHATALHLLGFDHTRLTYRHAGRDFRLTDVHGNVVKEILA
ncbi:MAG: DUF1501 domain-containing protein [Candidatus Solibacter usitatus]|nr:DUF1501 domain-containing protein [Candidatus Solibacter usitatus]